MNLDLDSVNVLEMRACKHVYDYKLHDCVHEYGGCNKTHC